MQPQAKLNFITSTPHPSFGLFGSSSTSSRTTYAIRPAQRLLSAHQSLLALREEKLDRRISEGGEKAIWTASCPIARWTAAPSAIFLSHLSIAIPLTGLRHVSLAVPAA
ncbi:hypothetical protein H0G86_011234 [Trichoderma simmonsii]|uniref:Uncharacterized protein n=1 Tax=Trichoderma simmonsii TaxID=1491479 RepID=A0A8G0LL51_9HYPO|nr:hypothetical protein H0G86_011234 [Trichoderma simmonsii]